jgi:hypothetical protein
VSQNVDERLLRHWHESQQRQKAVRRFLGRSSLSVDRFESWALDLISEALVSAGEGAGRTPPHPVSRVRPDTDDR